MSKTMDRVQIDGKDNYGNPRQEYANVISHKNDTAFLKEAEKLIWLSAYANNNPRSDYHWQADLCYREAVRRGKPELYTQAWERASKA